MELSPILAGGLTAAVAAVTALLCRPLGLRGLAAPVGCGLVAGLLALHGWPGLPPAESSAWLIHIVLAATLLGVLEDGARLRPPVRWLLRLTLGAAFILLLLKPLYSGHWHGIRRWLFPTALLGCTALLWTVLEQRTHRLPRLLLPMTILSLGTAMVALFSGFMKYGQAGALLALALGVCWLMASVGRLPPLNSGGITVVVPALAALWLGSFFYGEMPLFSAMLLPAATGVLWLVPIQRMNRWRRGSRAAVPALLLAVPVAFAVFVAYRNYISDPYR